MTGIPVAEAIDECSEMVRRWSQQERGQPSQPPIKDRDINGSLRRLRLVRDVATPDQARQIDRLVNATEALLNSVDWRQNGPYPRPDSD